MTIEDIRKFRNAEPFRPFQLVLSDGRKLLVREPEKIGLSPNGRSLGVYAERDSLHFLEIDSIVDVKPAPRATKKR
jgi:hypothetical protein